MSKYLENRPLPALSECRCGAGVQLRIVDDDDTKHKREQIKTDPIGELVSAVLTVGTTFTFTPHMDQVDNSAQHSFDLGTAQANMKYLQYRY